MDESEIKFTGVLMIIISLGVAWTIGMFLRDISDISETLKQIAAAQCCKVE